MEKQRRGVIDIPSLRWPARAAVSHFLPRAGNFSTMKEGRKKHASNYDSP
jgi:hypothetical protein